MMAPLRAKLQDTQQEVTVVGFVSIDNQPVAIWVDDRGIFGTADLEQLVAIRRL